MMSTVYIWAAERWKPRSTLIMTISVFVVEMLNSLDLLGYAEKFYVLYVHLLTNVVLTCGMPKAYV